MSESTLKVAAWVERRIDMTLGFHLPAARLYGIMVHDPGRLDDDADQPAARASFIEESSDAYSMVYGSAGVLARSFDAAAIVTTGWAAPMEADGTMSQRASRHPMRRRVRVVAVVDDEGVASVLRFEDDPTHMILQSERGIGDMVDALEAMWFGDPTAPVRAAPIERDIVNLRTTRAGCTRRP